MRKIDFGMFRMFCIFVMSNITQWRGDLPIRAGFLYLLLSIYGGFVPPFGVLMHPAQPLCCWTAGKAKPFVFCLFLLAI